MRSVFVLLAVLVAAPTVARAQDHAPPSPPREGTPTPGPAPTPAQAATPVLSPAEGGAPSPSPAGISDEQGDVIQELDPTLRPPEPVPAALVVEERPLERRWDDGPDRWFLAGIVDIGPLYFRPRLAVGYGSPHFRWVGIELNPILSGEGVGAYAGLRGTLPEVELRVGARVFSSFFRSFVEPQDHFSRLDLETRRVHLSQYLTAEAELSTGLPLGPVRIPLVLTGSYVALVEEGLWVFEDVIHVVAAPPWIWSVRSGLDFRFAPQKLVRLGFVAEVIGSPGRPAVVVRMGVAGSYRLWDILEIRAAVVPAILSPDELGAMAGQWFEVGLRFRFATGVASNLSLPTL